MSKGSLVAIAFVSFGCGLVFDRFVLVSKNGQNDDASALVSQARSAQLRMPTADDSNDPDALPTDPYRRLKHQLDRENETIDFEEAIRIAERLPQGGRRRELIWDIARRWARTDPGAALEWASSLTGDERTMAIESAIEAWAEEDALAALEYVAALPNSERSLDMVHRVARNFSDQNRAAALEWALAHADPNIRDRALRGALEHWTEEDPAAAAEFATTIDGRSEHLSALEQVAHRWARQDPQAALAWASSLQGEDRARSTREILHRVSDDDPQQAAAIYEELAADLPGGDQHEGPAWHIGRELASRWAHYSPADAAQWAMTLSEGGDLRRAAVHEVTQQWVHRDSIAASDWVNGLEVGKVRDSAAEIIVEHSTRRGDFESAVAWAQSVSDLDRQQELTGHVFEQWQKRDPAGAEASKP